jgi:hypothetical protein
VFAKYPPGVLEGTKHGVLVGIVHSHTSRDSTGIQAGPVTLGVS